MAAPPQRIESPENKQALDVRIQNVVASGNLGHRIDLDAIVKSFPHVEYNPKRFPGLVFRLKRPKATTLIFSTGKMICTGAKSEKLARSAIRKTARLLRENGLILLSKVTIEIVNVVATVDLGRGVDLEMAEGALDDVMYEPEQFPGLIVRMQEPKVVMLIFASGKMVCTGGRSESFVNEAAEKMSKMLEEENLFL
jgi:transcription initiation factor TFIID TATA-box-binding protein